MKNHGKENEQFFRAAWLCPRCRRKRSRCRQPLAVPVSCRKGWRRSVPACLSGAGADIRLHPADDRRGHRPPHQAERPQCLRNAQQKVEVPGLPHLPRPHAHHDVLLRHRRLDHEVFYPLPRLKRRCRRAGRVLHLVHHLPRLAHRLHADLFGADGVGRVLRRGKGH